MALMAASTFASTHCPCYTATTTIKPLFCERSVANTDICEHDCFALPTRTITIPTLNPDCSPTPTVTHYLPCCGGKCPTSTSTVTGDHTCEPKHGVEFGTSTSWSIITMAPSVEVNMHKHKARGHCYLTNVPGGLVPIEVCDPRTTVCSVCFGCEAPVTVCRAE